MKISNCCSSPVKCERDNEGVCMACGEHCSVEEEYEKQDELAELESWKIKQLSLQ